MEAGTELDVLICGSGAAGLTLAVELARRGIAFRLIDRLERPFPGSRGKGIQPRTLEVFEDMGIVDRLFAAGGPYPVVRSHRPASSFTDTDLTDAGAPTAAIPYPAPLMVPQFMTERILRERLAELGHRPDFGCSLVGIAQDADGVAAQVTGLNHAETVRARYLVGADGGSSFVRKTLEIGFPGKTLGVRAIVADVIMTGLDRSAWHRFNDGIPAQQLLLCPLAGTDLMQIQGPIPMEGEPDLSTKGLERMVAERTGRGDIAVQSVSWASAYTMNARLADHYRIGRCFLAGDAAHVHPPTGGQGLNTSVQDAYNLGWKLAAVLDGAPEALLDSYEAERRPIAAEMLGLATWLLDGAKQGEMRRDRATRQLDIGYPDSGLALQPAGDRLVMAGDRAPDARLRGAAGPTRRVFELLQGVHWTLFVYETEGIPARRGLRIHTIGRDVIDATGEFRAGYGVVPGECVLVRPDGYVGAIVGAGDDALLERYLMMVGLGA